MFALLGLIAGIVVGVVLQPTLPPVLAPYLPIAIVAAFDAILGATRAYLEGIFSDRVFLVSFLSNVIIAGLIVFVGDQIGVGSQLSTGVVVVLGLGEFVEHRQIVEALPQLGDPAQLGLRIGQLAGHLLRVVLVVPQVGIGCLHLQLVDPTTQLLEVENLLHGGQGGVEGFQINGHVGMHGLPGYRLPVA